MQAGELINAAEAAELLGCSKRTIARMAGDGRLTPALKLPGLRGDYLFQRTYIERLATTRRRKQEAS
jgi:excisionase family DNA binding protein